MRAVVAGSLHIIHSFVRINQVASREGACAAQWNCAVCGMQIPGHTRRGDSLKSDGHIHRLATDGSLAHGRAGAGLRVALHAATPHQRRVVLVHLLVTAARDDNDRAPPRAARMNAPVPYKQSSNAAWRCTPEPCINQTIWGPSSRRITTPRISSPEWTAHAGWPAPAAAPQQLSAIV